MAWSERALPWLSAACVAMALGLFAGGAMVRHAAANMSAGLPELRAQEEALMRELPLLSARAQLPSNLSDTLTFLDRAATVGTEIDVVDRLVDIREAAGADIRILRVRSVTGDVPALVVEGRLPDGSSHAELARFVERLRQRGLQPTPSEVTGSATSQQPTGFFAYRLTPLIETAPGVAP